MTEQQVVTFYAWIERQPSSLTIRIDGGEMGHSGGGENDKMTIKTPLKEARFNKGLFRTDDEQTIKVLREMIKRGETITEDHELYLSKVLSDKEQSNRNQKLAVDAAAETARLREENEKLRAKLAKRGKLGQADEAATAA